MFHNCRDVIRAPVQVHNKQSKDNVDSIYKCNTCDEEGWTSETEAALHAKTFHKKEINALVKNSSNKNPLCLVCLTKQPDVTALISHWKTLHLYSSPTAIRVEREIFICDNCGQVFFNKLFLQVHINHRKHIQFTKVVCPLCHKQVKRKCLSNHLFSHRALRISSCPICLHKCDNRSLLLKHINNTHRKHLLCDLCGFATTKVEFFNAHVNKYEERKCSMSEDGCSVEYEKYFLRSRLKTVWRNPVAR
ncbi:hypothetical protein evm_012064 [Chilo suppressalis]|nr:hypothetical protein evm_012064 [Chilo suppressalis]